MNKISDYIPTACHLDDETILTKAGSLVQIIKITGFETGDQQHVDSNLRQAVRTTIAEILNIDKISIYLHIIRERRNMRPYNDNEMQEYAKSVDDAWCRKNNWDKQLVNTLYISIVSHPIKIQALQLSNFIPKKLKDIFFSQCQKKLQLLNQCSQIILQKLKAFSASKLKIIEKNGQIISQQMSFYYKLVNLVEKDIALEEKNLSKQISEFDIKYLLNTMEFSNAEQAKQFAAVYTVKSYTELSPEIYDKLLQLGQQFIITECFYPVAAKDALQDFREIKEVIDIGADKMLAEVGGLTRIFSANKGNNTDYSAHQLSIIVHSDDMRFFNDRVVSLVKTLQGMGISIVREDYNMAKVFWSQLPGNLRYMTRISYIDTASIGGLTSIHHKKIGNYRGSKWGAPITMFRTIDGNPFYFNFHHKENGNTLIIGPTEAGKSTLAHFLVTQSMRLQPRLIYLDLEGKGETFMDALGGTYFTIPENDESPFKINPLSLELFNNNATAAQHWLHQAIAPQDLEIGQYNEFFHLLTQAIFQKSDGEHNAFETLKSLIESSADEVLITGFNKVIGSPIFNNLFAQDEVDLFESDKFLSFNLSKLKDSPNLLELFLPVMLQKIVAHLDGSPSIILINNANPVYESPSFNLLLSDWLQAVNNKNALAIMLFQHDDKHLNNPFIQANLPHYATKIFFADKYATPKFRKLYLLNEDELRTIKSYEKERRMFLMKQSSENIIGSINLTTLAPEIKGPLL